MKRSFEVLIVASLLLVVVGAVWLLTKSTPTIPLAAPATTRVDFEPLLPIRLGGADMFASVADSPSERQLGLSRTTALPADVVKLFVFPTEDLWSFWMKEMLYSIDIIWLDATGKIVHIESAVSPETYPNSFTPSSPAKYVIETNAGFVATQNMQVGDMVALPAVSTFD